MNRENEKAMFAGKNKSGLTKEQVGIPTMKTCKDCGKNYYSDSCIWCLRKQLKSDSHKRQIEWNRSSNSTNDIEERIEKVKHDILWKKEIDKGHFHPRESTLLRLDKITIPKLEAKLKRLEAKLKKRETMREKQ